MKSARSVEAIGANNSVLDHQIGRRSNCGIDRLQECQGKDAQKMGDWFQHLRLVSNCDEGHSGKNTSRFILALVRSPY